MRLFKTKVFQRFARKSDLDDAALIDAIARAVRGLIDADLGGGVIKLRLARPGAGRSGGFRTIVLFRAAERAVFVYGFGKNERDNIRDDELAEFKRLASVILAYSEDDVRMAIEHGVLIEVAHEPTIS